MSVDIAWDLITSGADGDALAESIRAFIHAKFQQVTLPRFINSVHVHSFEFGSVCPDIEIKDIGDPLPDFYEDEDENEDVPDELESDALSHDESAKFHAGFPNSSLGELHPTDLHNRVAALQSFEHHARIDTKPRPLHASATGEGVRSLGETMSGHFARSGTPGIPGGTSNMNYFHLPLGGLSGAQTPLAAVAGGGPFATQAWLQDQHFLRTAPPDHRSDIADMDGSAGHGSVRRRTADSIPSPELGSPFYPSSPEKRPVNYFPAEKISDDVSSSAAPAETLQHPQEIRSPNDLQVVSRVTYNGDVRMMLTAEIMLDYPMPSFVKIPLKLSITGVTFDGVAILAYIKKKMHFCFLDPEDAEAFVGSAFANETDEARKPSSKTSSIGSLLREIRVETEIGRQESGKQVLKNVGKVERFVLEQVRRIFEDEFVFPSFWTFLV